MRVEAFIRELPCEYFAGVPDSQLKALCDYLYLHYGTGRQHCIAHNEGGAVALAAGYHLATGKIPCVYLQNSGIGNIANPVCSLTSPDVYAIPTVFVVGWRGEPGIKDEPQHVYQGKVTLPFLDVLGIEAFVVGTDTTPEQVHSIMEQRFLPALKAGRSVAFVIRKGALEQEEAAHYANHFTMTREEAIRRISMEEGVFVSTTGKASRELFEARAARGEGHERDFLTVGSMGHCAMIALGVAQQMPDKRVWCLDGDGAALMHMGAWAVIGSRAPNNLIHVIMNNEAHDSVGGMPTSGGCVDYSELARACGYRQTFRIAALDELEDVLSQIRGQRELTLLEVDVQIGSRKDLGRPTTTPQENKQSFMRFVAEEEQQ